MIRLKYYYQKVKDYYKKLFIKVVEKAFFRTFVGKHSFYNYYKNFHALNLIQQNNYINNAQDKEVIFYVFRGVHCVDNFIPIHLSIMKLFPDKFQIFYISDFAAATRDSSVIGIIKRSNELQKILTTHNINHVSHFDRSYIRELKSFPDCDMMLFSENVDDVSFGEKHRVYLPRYIVLKAKLKKDFRNIKDLNFNHMFSSSTEEFFYSRKQILYKNRDVKIHNVGYPKFKLDVDPKKLFNNKQKTIIYAPSLEKEILFEFLDDGILEVFASLPTYNIIIKLHPSLAAGKQSIVNVFLDYAQKYQNIKIDELSPIQSLIKNSDLLIADYGSVAAEYKLLSGKRVMCLKVPEKYEGGSDLMFRDKYADEICEIKTLKRAIEKNLNFSEMENKTLQKVRDDVLYHYNDSDIVCATRINKILYDES